MAEISDGWVLTAEFFSPQISGVELYILYPTALTGDFWGTAKSQGTLPLPRQPWTCLQEINLRQLRKPPRSLRTVFFPKKKHIVLLAKFSIFGDKFWLETLRCSNTKTQMKSWMSWSCNSKGWRQADDDIFVLPGCSFHTSQKSQFSLFFVHFFNHQRYHSHVVGVASFHFEAYKINILYPKQKSSSTFPSPKIKRKTPIHLQSRHPLRLPGFGDLVCRP